MHTSGPDCSTIQPTSSVGYGVNRICRCTYSVGRSESRGSVPRASRTPRTPIPSAASTTAPRSRPARSHRCAARGSGRARRRRSSSRASAPAGAGCPCSRRSGSSPRHRGSREGSGARCGSSLGSMSSPVPPTWKTIGTPASCRAPTPGRARCGSASGRAGSPDATRSAAAPMASASSAIAAARSKSTSGT